MLHVLRVGLVFLVLAACAPKPPSVVVPQKPRALTVAFEGGENLNPAVNGTPAPVQVRVLLLSDVEAFQTAGYFELMEDPEGVLAAALVAEDKLFVEPDGAASFKSEIDSKVTHIGIVVGFRDYDEGTWRLTVPVAKRRIGGLRRDFLLDGSTITQRMQK